MQVQFDGWVNYSIYPNVVSPFLKGMGGNFRSILIFFPCTLIQLDNLYIMVLRLDIDQGHSQLHLEEVVERELGPKAPYLVRIRGKQPPNTLDMKPVAPPAPEIEAPPKDLMVHVKTTFKF